MALSSISVSEAEVDIAVYLVLNILGPYAHPAISNENGPFVLM